MKKLMTTLLVTLLASGTAFSATKTNKSRASKKVKRFLGHNGQCQITRHSKRKSFSRIRPKSQKSNQTKNKNQIV